MHRGGVDCTCFHSPFSVWRIVHPNQGLSISLSKFSCLRLCACCVCVMCTCRGVLCCVALWRGTLWCVWSGVVVVEGEEEEEEGVEPLLRYGVVPCVVVRWCRWRKLLSLGT